MIKKTTISFYLLSFCFLARAEQMPFDSVVLQKKQMEISDIRSAFNSCKVFLRDSTGKYSFLVTGHLHGSSNNQSGFPAASVLANIDHINSMNLVFIASTGDLFMDPEKDAENYKKYFFQKINTALFNAPGNHDVKGSRPAGNAEYLWFRIDTEKFLFLDTEINDGNIKDGQFNMLKAELERKEEDIKNIFVFSHRPVWAENDEEMKDFFLDNTRSSWGNNFKPEIEPLLINASKTKNIFWCSGSLGNAPASFFYHKDKNGITYIQSAIRDLPRDAVLKVNVDHGKISFETVSLNSNKVKALEYYNIEYWKKHYKDKPPFNFRLIPLYVKNTVTHRYYWYGILSCFVAVLAAWLIMRKRKKK